MRSQMGDHFLSYPRCMKQEDSIIAVLVARYLLQQPLSSLFGPNPGTSFSLPGFNRRLEVINTIDGRASG